MVIVAVILKDPDSVLVEPVDVNSNVTSPGAALPAGALKLTVRREAISDNTASKTRRRLAGDTRYELIDTSPWNDP